MYPNVVGKKSWSSMSQEERLEDLREQVKELTHRTATQSDINAELRSENQFLRRFIAVKSGLDEKQVEQLFDNSEKFNSGLRKIF